MQHRSCRRHRFHHTFHTCLLGGLLLATAAGDALPARAETAGKQPSAWVDPFIGTGGDGHTFPGAVVPFGMVQLSPDTERLWRGIDPQPDIYRHCAGYHYDDTTITGFSHTHFSGTGHSDLGDLLIMPMTGPVHLEPGTAADPDAGYRSRFSHASEEASPGYYAVDLADYGIRAELTATPRTGLHRYTFNDAGPAHVLLDLTASIYDFDHKVVWSDVRIVDDRTLLIYRATNGWARHREMYFAVRFSRPFADLDLINEDNERYRCNGCLDADAGGARPSTIVNTAEPYTAGKAVKVVAHFDDAQAEPLLIQVGLSAVSRSGALANLAAEQPEWDFDRVREEARRQWDRQLSRFDADGEPSRLRQFYTAAYHALQAPSLYQDVDGNYRGVDGEIHRADGFTNHTLFSLWDTYRALHPLLTIVAPEVVPDMVLSMLAHYRESYNGMLPIWSFHGHETWTMIGYHAVSVIADAWLKGLLRDRDDFDPAEALAAMVATANNPHYDGITDYRALGYVPADRLAESVSITLEYAYDDFAIARMAADLGDTAVAGEFFARAGSYRNVFDPAVGFMRGRDTAGIWDPAFDPEEALLMGPFTEGNSFQYTFYVPHDVAGLIDLIGGDDAFVARLDQLFTRPLAAEKIREHEDIAGLIGQYAHGNEPSHHIAYLYDYAGQPWRTQERVRQIMDTLASDRPDGLAGNDDVGQMSAWYVFSVLGFYPVAPGDLCYAIGAPQLPRVALQLGGGRTFTVEAEGLSRANLYVAAVTLNGKSLDRSWLSHAEIAAGGVLHFTMGDQPNRSWAAGPGQRPPSMNRRP